MLTRILLTIVSPPERCLRHLKLLNFDKKPDADYKQFSNFRPISNLKMISKVVENSKWWLCCLRTTLHLINLMNGFNQLISSIIPLKLPLLGCRMTQIVLLTMRKSVFLLLLDLSAAFDTVDHATLVSRLSDCFSIQGAAQAWFESYFESRKYYVHVEGGKSNPLCKIVDLWGSRGINGSIL